MKLTNPSTGLERTVQTDANGEFNFPELSLGTYRLAVTKVGFQTMVVTDIMTSQGGVNSVTPTLTVGSVTSSVEVTSAPPLLQTETNSVGGQLSEQQVNALPIGNSDYTRLALTLPGVTQNSNFAFAQYTINGSRSRSNGFNIDGASDTDPSTYLPSINEGGNSATAATRLPLDAIQEVTVVSAGGADSGQNSGSVMNVIVKSGTNEFHGSAYEIHRDAALDAANYFENLAGNPKAPFVWNEFGGVIGGPIIISRAKNRTFFSRRLRRQQTAVWVSRRTDLLPTPQQITDATNAVHRVTEEYRINWVSISLAYIHSSGCRGHLSPTTGDSNLLTAEF